MPSIFDQIQQEAYKNQDLTTDIELAAALANKLDVTGGAHHVQYQLTRGNYITGTGAVNYDGSAVATWNVDATIANSSNKIVVRDGTGGIFASYYDGVKPKLNALVGNLGSPTTEEMAIIEGQFSNKVRFTLPTLTEESTDGISYIASTRLSTNQLGDIFIGGGQNNLYELIPASSTLYYRMTWQAPTTFFPNNLTYVFFNALYAYMSTNGNNVQITIEAQRPDTNAWEQITTGSITGWPIHAFMRHDKIACHINETTWATQRHKAVRLTFSATTTTYNIQLGSLEWFGGYPAGRRSVEYYDRDKNVYFPNLISGTRLYSTTTTSAPFSVASTIQVPNLNADMLDGNHASAFALASHTHAIADVTNLQTTLDAKQATLVSGTNIKTVNGSSILGTGDIVISVPTKTSDLTNDSGFITSSYVTTAISNVIDAAPGTLDTLNELAAALGDDPNFATTMTTSLSNKLDSTAYTASDVLTKLKTVDGTGSLLDADLLDGNHASAFALASHNHAIADVTNLQTTLDAKAGTAVATTSVNGLMSSTDKTKLDGVAANANNYVHPTTDGSLHVPATSTTNNGKVLKAGATAGSIAWGTLTAADVGAAATSHTHAIADVTNLQTTLDAKQATLVSGTNIKTVNGNSLLGAGDIVISGSITLTDDTTTNATYYPVFAMAATGAMTGKASSTKLNFNPSTGALTSTLINGISGIATATPLAPAVTALVGTATKAAKEDHVHPTNFSVTTTDIKMNGTQSLGTLLTFPRADHVHPKDTSKQDTLVSGTNIKTINGSSILGSGDLVLEDSIGTTITAATTINIGAAGTKRTMYLTGSTVVTSFGISTTGIRRTLICITDVNIVSNITSLKTPGPSDITGATNGSVLECLCIDGANGYWQILNITVPTQGSTQMLKLLTLHNISAGLIGTSGNGGYRSAISGTDIKTINGSSILGSGDLVISGSGTSVPVGGGTDKVFYENDNTLNTSYTLTANKNMVSAGPITVAATAVINIPSTTSWTIV